MMGIYTREGRRVEAAGDAEGELALALEPGHRCPHHSATSTVAELVFGAPIKWRCTFSGGTWHELPGSWEDVIDASPPLNDLTWASAIGGASPVGAPLRVVGSIDVLREAREDLERFAAAIGRVLEMLERIAS